MVSVIRTTSDAFGCNWLVGSIEGIYTQGARQVVTEMRAKYNLERNRSDNRPALTNRRNPPARTSLVCVQYLTPRQSLFTSCKVPIPLKEERPLWRPGALPCPRSFVPEPVRKRIRGCARFRGVWTI